MTREQLRTLLGADASEQTVDRVLDALHGEISRHRDEARRSAEALAAQTEELEAARANGERLDETQRALDELVNDPISYGTVLRAKGIVPCDDGTWIHFDYVPGAPDVRHGPAGFTGRLCVIGSDLKEEPLNELFHL